MDNFIAEHYWGYARQRDGSTLGYRVEHPPWEVWCGGDATLDCEIESIYGEPWVPVLRAEPVSAFVAVGSDVSVRRGTKVV